MSDIKQIMDKQQIERRSYIDKRILREEKNNTVERFSERGSSWYGVSSAIDNMLNGN